MEQEQIDKHISRLEEPHLTWTELRVLQYEIKQAFDNAEKQKYFGMINVYKEEKDIWLKCYLTDLLNELKQ